MLIIDRRFDGVFFDSGEGGAPVLYEHLAYIFFTGAYVIVVVAAAGAISEILPTFARKPIFSHRAVAASMVAIAVLGLLAWMQNMYIAPLNEGWTIMAMAFALALAVPIGTLFYVWVATIWGGALELRAATLVRAARDLDDGVRPRRRARLLGDPGRLGARQHDRQPGRHALRARRRRRASAASRRCTTGSRSSAGACWARASASSPWC